MAIPCPECGVTFTPERHNQRFCCHAHKDAYWNREKKQGILLPEAFREDTQKYAESWDCTLREAAAKIYAEALRWQERGQPLTDEQIFGREREA